ncbi:Quinonprotein alcohol dehydrogenase-like-superfamily [Cynara cardunculus var. scolymus]|uniref:Quinonprotein alcohol dehydrogenase-like-superfamily n=1 Tax=Cynara cardunculus var. scolymus TaxID=59895 RepID=A0A103DTY6_CYNCS|nr:Quinonprotein alcohol dehydrogenase-like-superfamily [Cynara cardunculus var. scolymus]
MVFPLHIIPHRFTTATETRTYRLRSSENSIQLTAQWNQTNQNPSLTYVAQLTTAGSQPPRHLQRMTSVTLKKNYRGVQSLQQFYSGGPYTVSSDGSFIACACNDTITIVDSSNASIKSTIEGDSEPVTAIALSPDDKFLFSASHSRQIRLFSGSDDATVRVWDLTSKKCIATLERHRSTVTSIAITEDGWTLLSGGRDQACLNYLCFDVD